MTADRVIRSADKRHVKLLFNSLIMPTNKLHLEQHKQCALVTKSVVSQCCLTTQTDPGSTKLRQLDQTLERVECDVVNDITYRDYRPQDGEHFDFIVVGAGSAGSVMANRLSENTGWRVLVLEAGGDPDITSEFPSLSGTLVGSQLDWNYTAEPDPRYCLSSVNQRCKWPRGKVLGGCSTINDMWYVRGDPEVYNSWEREGNVGWGYGSLLPYFKKSEDLKSGIIKDNTNYKCFHGECRYLTVNTIYQECDLKRFDQNLSKGFSDLGYGTFNDVNAQYHEGLFTFQGTIRDGRRCSTAKAFLKQAQQRVNLKISKCSLVTQVLFSQNKTAYGVILEKNGVSVTLLSRKEVILSAGSVNSPQLLMLSGIGPRDHLNDLGIQLISDLPVGYNLQDHYAVRGYFVSLQTNLLKPDDNEALLSEIFEAKETVDINKKNNAVAFIKTSQAPYPNIEFYFNVIAANSTEVVNQLNDKYGYNDVYKRAVAALNNRTSLLIVFIDLTKPQSAGRILLRSTNPREYPVIIPNYLANKEDIEAFLEAIAFLNRLVKTESLKKLDARVERIDVPYCRAFLFQSADYWKCMMRYSGGSDYHPVGTCRMGPRGSPLSVVDPNLRVIGVSGLRVVDGSIMPTVSNGNLNAPIVAIAEKASDLVKLAWRSG